MTKNWKKPSFGYPILYLAPSPDPSRMTRLGRIPPGRFLIRLLLSLLDLAGRLPPHVELEEGNHLRVMMAEGAGDQPLSLVPSALRSEQLVDASSADPQTSPPLLVPPMPRAPKPGPETYRRLSRRLKPSGPLRQLLHRCLKLNRRQPTLPTSPKLPEGPSGRLGRLALALGAGLQQRSSQEYRRLRFSSTPRRKRKGPLPGQSLLHETTAKPSVVRSLLGRRPR